MLKFIYKIFKKVILAVFFLYGYNLIANNLGVIIPINIFTVSAITILGIPALISLIILNIFVF